MTDKTMREIIENEAETFFEFPTEGRTHVTTVSAKLFAEHVLRSLGSVRIWSADTAYRGDEHDQPGGGK